MDDDPYRSVPPNKPTGRSRAKATKTISTQTTVPGVLYARKAFLAPSGTYEYAVDGTERRYGQLLKCKGYRIGRKPITARNRNPDAEDDDDMSDDDTADAADADSEFTDEQLAEIEAAVLATADKAIHIEPNEDQRRLCLRHSMRYGIYGNPPSAAEMRRGASAGARLDLSALARVIVDNNATLNTDVRDTIIRPMQEEIFRLRTQVLSLTGEAIGFCPTTRFEAPSRAQSKAQNRAMRRRLEAMEPHLNAIWEQTDGDEDSTDGFENLIAYFAEGGMDGSGRHAKDRWVKGKRLVAKMHAQPLTRRTFEVERTRHKIWAPSAFNTKEREGHVGARQWKATRPFMSRQCPGANVLLVYLDIFIEIGIWVLKFHEIS